MKKLLYYNSFVTVGIFFTRIFTYVNYSTSQTVKYLTTENSSNIQNVLNSKQIKLRIRCAYSLKERQILRRTVPLLTRNDNGKVQKSFKNQNFSIQIDILK